MSPCLGLTPAHPPCSVPAAHAPPLKTLRTTLVFPARLRGQNDTVQYQQALGTQGRSGLQPFFLSNVFP